MVVRSFEDITNVFSLLVLLSTASMKICMHYNSALCNYHIIFENGTLCKELILLDATLIAAVSKL
jgi:hypothetical protein